MTARIDNLDLRILSMLQKDGSLTQRDLAEGIGLSQNALWRRLQALQAAGVMQGSRVMVEERDKQRAEVLLSRLAMHIRETTGDVDG